MNSDRIIDPLMDLFRGAVFRHGGGARRQPINQPTEIPTSTMALMGRFTSLMGRWQTLMGRFPEFALMGRFPSRKSPGKQPIKKRGIKRFLTETGFGGVFGDSLQGSFFLSVCVSAHLRHSGCNSCQKKRDVHKISARNSVGPEMAAPIVWTPGSFLVVSAGKPPCP